MATIPLPMLAAARDGKADTLRDLLQHGIEGTPCLPDACNVIGQTCLHFAAMRRRIPVEKRRGVNAVPAAGFLRICTSFFSTRGPDARRRAPQTPAYNTHSPDSVRKSLLPGAAGSHTEIALCRGNQGWRPEPRKASELAGLHVTVTPPFHLNLTCTCTVCVWCVSRGSAAGSGVCFEVGCVARDALRASWGGWGGGGLG